MVELSDASSFFQTTIKIGKRDIHELTNKAVEMALGVGFLGGAGIGDAELPGLALAMSSSTPSSSRLPPTFNRLASQRMVKCCDDVVIAQ